MERKGGLGTPSSRRKRDDQDLHQYPEEPILRSDSGFAIAIPYGVNLVEERIKDAAKTKEIMDMPALMALVEQIAKRTLVEKNEGGVQDDSQERHEVEEDSPMLYPLGISQDWLR